MKAQKVSPLEALCLRCARGAKERRDCDEDIQHQLHTRILPIVKPIATVAFSVCPSEPTLRIFPCRLNDNNNRIEKADSSTRARQLESRHDAQTPHSATIALCLNDS
ncbi:MAG TPA: hypothetical protein VE175_05500 [Woeseiaceae bacterium]|jgi:hypothetical protein|nr:hypothetical protein [Woeseiaceae bacterium]